MFIFITMNNNHHLLLAEFIGILYFIIIVTTVTIIIYIEGTRQWYLVHGTIREMYLIE